MKVFSWMAHTLKLQKTPLPLQQHFQVKIDYFSTRTLIENVVKNVLFAPQWFFDF
jgi:hypothetical protein